METFSLIKKANSDDKCYNYHKLRHFRQYCFLFIKKLNKSLSNFEEKNHKEETHKEIKAKYKLIY